MTAEPSPAPKVESVDRVIEQQAEVCSQQGAIITETSKWFARRVVEAALAASPPKIGQDAVERVALLEPGWDLVTEVIEAWAAGFTSGSEISGTLLLVAKDLKANRDKVISSYVHNVGIFDPAIAKEGDA